MHRTVHTRNPSIYWYHQPIRLAPLAVVHYMGMRDEITSAGLNIY